MKKTVLMILSLIMCLALFTGCETEDVQKDPTDSRTLSLDQTEMIVIVGEKPTKLNAVLSSGKGAFQWASSDTQVVTVDQEGRVTGVSIGSATVTVKCGTLAPATCKVNVVLPGYVPVFTADPTGEGICKTIAVGGTLQLDNSLKFNGELVDAKLTFASQNPSIVTVSDTGVIMGVKAGTAQVQVVADYLGLETHMTVEVTVLAE